MRTGYDKKRRTPKENANETEYRYVAKIVDSLSQHYI